MRKVDVYNTIGIMLVALIIHLIVWVTDPHSFEPKEDSAQYNTLAKSLVEHGVMSLDKLPPLEPSARRVPAYPLFLASIYSAASPKFTLAKLAQVVFGPVWCLLVLLIGRRIFDSSGPALAAAILVAILPPILVAGNRLMPEGLFTMLLLLGTYTTYCWVDLGGVRWAACTGLIWGALGLTKPEAVLLPIAVIPVAVVLRSDWRRGTIEGIFAASVASVLVGTWVYRNDIVIGRPCLISGSGDGSGPGMLHGYRLRAENGFTFRPERYKFLYGDNWREREADFQAAKNGPVSDPSVGDVKFWLERPLLFAKYSLIRFIGLMKPASWSHVVGLDRDFSQAKTSNLLVVAAKGALLLLDIVVLASGMIGFLVSFRPIHRRWWIITATIAYFIAVYALVHGIPRYREPLYPLLLMLGVWWLSTYWNRCRRRRTVTVPIESI